ncbi:hypothetical protein ACFE04_002681 [Oxalis oulophora]
MALHHKGVTTKGCGGELSNRQVKENEQLLNEAQASWEARDDTASKGKELWKARPEVETLSGAFAGTEIAELRSTNKYLQKAATDREAEKAQQAIEFEEAMDDAISKGKELGEARAEVKTLSSAFVGAWTKAHLLVCPKSGLFHYNHYTFPIDFATSGDGNPIDIDVFVHTRDGNPTDIDVFVHTGLR